MFRSHLYTSTARAARSIQIQNDRTAAKRSTCERKSQMVLRHKLATAHVPSLSSITEASPEYSVKLKINFREGCRFTSSR
jgi:hypothetical protein